MPITKAARRYANAFLELARERDEVGAVLDDVTFIHNTLKDSRELVMFLKSPIISYDDKIAVLNELFFDKVGEPARLFIKLLARKERVNLLDQIAEAFIELYKKYAGIITIDVYAARELSEDQREALHGKLEQKTQKKVELSVTIDESLRGGMAIRIDDTVIDGTVKHKLAELEESLLSTVIE